MLPSMARTHVIIDDEILARVDEVVGERGRSRFLQEAAREKLERVALERALLETAGTVTGHPEWSDRDSAAAWVRNGRASETRS
jgi:metal-responsive CopG/Arc/MetJ family transcriptional regulator